MNNLIVKSFTTTKNGDNIKSVTYLDDNGVEVTMSSASMLHGSSTLQSNGTYNFDDGEYAGVKTVVVNVETQGTIKEKNYDITLNQDAQDIQITSDITTSDNYDEEVNTGKVHIPDSRLTSKEANLSKSENVTVLPDHYGLSSVVVPPVDSRLILKDETLTGTQRRSNSCDMTNLVGQYGSDAGWVEVPIEANPNNQKYGYEAIFLPNTRLQYQYITRQEILDWIDSKNKFIINPDPGMFGLSSVVLPAIKDNFFDIQPNKNVVIEDNGRYVITPDDGYDAIRKLSIVVNTIGGGGDYYDFIGVLSINGVSDPSPFPIQPICDIESTYNIEINFDLEEYDVYAVKGVRIKITQTTGLTNVRNIQLKGVSEYFLSYDESQGDLIERNISGSATNPNGISLTSVDYYATQCTFVKFTFESITIYFNDDTSKTIYLMGNYTNDVIRS